MVMDQSLFTRAKCKTTKAVAALPIQAMKDGHWPDWEAVDGPLPEGPKSATVFPVLVAPAEQEAAPEPKTAGTSSAKKKE